MSFASRFPFSFAATYIPTELKVELDDLKEVQQASIGQSATRDCRSTCASQGCDSLGASSSTLAIVFGAHETKLGLHGSFFALFN